MEKSGLSTRDRMCSVAGGMAGLLVDREIPSRLIPFRGEFPLLDMIEARRFREAIRSTMWIEDLPPKFLYAAAEGSRIARLEREFRHYLSRNGLKSGDFEKLEDAEKSKWLRWWMEADSVSADDFVVKKYRDEATPASKSLGDPAMPVAEKREIYDDLVARRAYWDDLCFEFGRVSWEKKLLNLALYIHYGGDLEVVLARYKENHPDYADRIPHSLAYYISYLRTGEATSVLHYFLLERVCLSEGQLTALLTAELRERLEEVFCWDGGTNSAWTIGIDYRGEEKMDEIITTLDIERGREYLIFGNLTIKPLVLIYKVTVKGRKLLRPLCLPCTLLWFRLGIFSRFLELTLCSETISDALSVCDSLRKQPMVGKVAFTYRIRSFELPSSLSHIIHGINHRIEL